MQHVAVLIFEFIAAETAYIPVWVVGIHRENREIKGLVSFGELCQLFLGVLKELFVLNAPPADIVILGNLLFPFRCSKIPDLIIAVILKILIPSCKAGVGSHHQHIFVALVLQHLSQGDGARQEGTIFAHGVFLHRNL